MTKRREEFRITREIAEAALKRMGIDTPLDVLCDEYAAKATWHHWTGVTPLEEAPCIDTKLVAAH